MRIDQFSDCKILRANKSLQFDLFTRFIKKHIYLVHVVQSLVKQKSLDVMLLSKELLEFNESILLRHEEQTLPFKLCLLCHSIVPPFKRIAYRLL